MATTKKLYAARDFNDAGTEKAFSAGDDVTNEPGVVNYTAAGLTTDVKPKTDADADPALTPTA